MIHKLQIYGWIILIVLKTGYKLQIFSDVIDFVISFFLFLEDVDGPKLDQSLQIYR